MRQCNEIGMRQAAGNFQRASFERDRQIVAAVHEHDGALDASPRLGGQHGGVDVLLLVAGEHRAEIRAVIPWCKTSTRP